MRYLARLKARISEKGAEGEGSKPTKLGFVPFVASGSAPSAQISGQEIFEFAPPNDPANDDEALQERIALMIEGGMDEARARKEAAWWAHSERCYRVSLRNAQRVLAVPEAHREALLSRYQAEATRRYGEADGRDMALSLESWVKARGVH